MFTSEFVYELTVIRNFYSFVLIKFHGFFFSKLGSCPQSDIKIKEGKVDIIYASPETLVGDPEWRASIQNLPVSVLVIDEFHTIATWYV